MNSFYKIKNIPSNIIYALENKKIPFINYPITFFFILQLRFFFESYSTTVNYFNLPTERFLLDMIHYDLAFITLAFLFIYLFHFTVHASIEKSARVVLCSFILILLAPLLDLVFTHGKGVDIYYIAPGLNINILLTYLGYGWNFSGISLGIKCEVLVALIGCFTYFRTKECNRLLSLFYTFLCYSLIFIWAASPYFIKSFLTIARLSADFASNYNSLLMIHFYLISVFILGTGLFYLANKRLFIVLIKDLRLLRLLHYELMLCFGVVFAYAKTQSSLAAQLSIQPHIIINFFLCMISILLSGVYSIIMNNIEDVAIDTISSPHRPLIVKAITLPTYQKIAYASLGLALFYAALISAKAFLLICFINASYYIYSVAPIRFKRVMIISKITLSLNSIALIVLGFILVFDNLYLFPTELFWIYLIGYTLACNFIDLKDIRGDRAAGILTLPTLLPLSQAKLLIGLAFWLTYLAFFCLFKNANVILLLLLVGGAQFFLINKRNYQETPILWLYNGSLIFLIIGIWQGVLLVR